jgi:UDP-N-acetylglucosamine diphosphorylase / glucose-1-phosphate thymidylyltransferase / UDP-N-acetylgalactosamine diphosphorylase / glucosamine-1-phosphate N-acetyltransferase / galactosamine-1-phosphate N-acetyltransferase
MTISLETLIELDGLHHESLFAGADPLALIGGGLTKLLASLLDELGVGAKPRVAGSVSPHAILEGRVYVADGASVGPTAYVIGPAYIGPGAEVRHGAFVRGGLYLGPRAVCGHATEVKNSIFFDGAKAGHFAYVGDSILGRDSNLGAGTKLANLKVQKGEVAIRDPDTGAAVPTGLRKLGALVGDGAQTGCNAVLSPGTILYPGTAVMPCAHFLGTLREGRFPKAN